MQESTTDVEIYDADEPRSIKGEQGLSTFASVFSLHNAPNQTKGEVIPITVKAFDELAVTTVTQLKKGVAFVVEGRFACYNASRHETEKIVR